MKYNLSRPGQLVTDDDCVFQNPAFVNSLFRRNDMPREVCNNTNDGQWAHCAVCGGRIHEEGCTTRKRRGVDCPGQQYHTPEEMQRAGYGPASQFDPALPHPWYQQSTV